MYLCVARLLHLSVTTIVSAISFVWRDSSDSHGDTGDPIPLLDSRHPNVEAERFTAARPGEASNYTWH